MNRCVFCNSCLSLVSVCSNPLARDAAFGKSASFVKPKSGKLKLAHCAGKGFPEKVK